MQRCSINSARELSNDPGEPPPSKLNDLAPRSHQKMPRLIFDIETSALPLDRFDEAQKEYLFRECQKIADELERSNRRAEIERQCSLWPFTSQVVCIAMLNADTNRGQVLYRSE